MELKNQLSNKELSQKLKELGVKQDSLFYWWEYESFGNGTEIYVSNKTANTSDNSFKKIICSAFTVSELGEILPNHITNKNGDRLYLEMKKGDSDDWYINYNNDFEQHFEVASVEADVRAKMLIYLIENKLIKL